MKYINYSEHNYEELFDVKHGPHEIDNVAKNLKYEMKPEELKIRYKELKEMYGIPKSEWVRIKTVF